jgi:hypothetical protein
VVSDAPGQGNLVDLVGWVTLENRSGKMFENARIKLMAGDVNKEGVVGGIALAKEARRAAPITDAMAPVVSEKAFDEFHLYTLERPSKQVGFVRATGIHSQPLYIDDGLAKQNSFFHPGQVQQDPNYTRSSLTVKPW